MKPNDNPLPQLKIKRRSGPTPKGRAPRFVDVRTVPYTSIKLKHPLRLWIEQENGTIIVSDNCVFRHGSGDSIAEAMEAYSVNVTTYREWLREIPPRDQLRYMVRDVAWFERVFGD